MNTPPTEAGTGIPPIPTPAPPVEKVAVDAPLLLEIKASVEKLSGEVSELKERMNKELSKQEPLPTPPNTPPPAAPMGEQPNPTEAKPDDEVPADQPTSQSATGLDNAPSATPTKSKTSKQDEKKPKDDEEMPPEDKKPKDDEEETKGTNPEVEALKSQVASLKKELSDTMETSNIVAKALGIPVKRTQVITKSALEQIVDPGTLSWKEIHAMARPYDLANMHR